MTRLAVLDGFVSKTAVFWLTLLSLLAANIGYSYYQYTKLKEYNYVTLKAKLVSSKELKSKDGTTSYFSVLFRSPQMDFRTYYQTNMKRFEGSYFDVIVDTKKLSFIDLFKPPRVKLTSIKKSDETDGLQLRFKEFIASQHESEKAKEIYLNLFLNSEVSPEVEEFINGYGLGAFFAISGLNVALLMSFIFLLFIPPFKLLQDRYFPYINREFWILLPSFALLLLYAYLTDFTPSFIRAVVASIILFFFALRGEELLNYKTLFLTTAVCLAIFPSFLFSIGFWLSFYGVFLIYLFLANNKLKNKVAIYVALSSWLFVAMLPVIHYIFALFTKAHLLNSLFSAIFDAFYPLSLVAHLVGFGWIFDDWIVSTVDSAKELVRAEFLTPTWFFVLHIALSFIAAIKKEGFFAFNIFAFGYLFAGIYVSLSAQPS